jgi:hypothetical protein
MTLIKTSAVRQLVREFDKQASSEFIEQLDYRVRNIVLRAVKNAKHFKRLKASELI